MKHLILYLVVVFFCTSFYAFTGSDYQVITVSKISVEPSFHPSGKVGTFLYTDIKSIKNAFVDLNNEELKKFDFDANRFVHIQYPEQNACEENVDVIQEVRRYKHYYEVIIAPIQVGNCKKTVKPYQVMTLPNDGLPVLFSGNVPE